MKIGVERQFTFVPNSDEERSTFASQNNVLSPTDIQFGNHRIVVDLATGNLTIRVEDAGYRYHALPFAISRSYDAQRSWVQTSTERRIPNVEPKPSWYANWQFGWESQVNETWLTTTYELHVVGEVVGNALFCEEGSTFCRHVASLDELNNRLLAFGVPATMLRVANFITEPGDLFLRSRRGPLRLLVGRSIPETLTDEQNADLCVIDPVNGVCARIAADFIYNILASAGRDRGIQLLATNICDSLGHQVSLDCYDSSPPYTRFVLRDGGGREFHIDMSATDTRPDLLNAFGTVNYHRIAQITDTLAGGRQISYTYTDNVLTRVDTPGALGTRSAIYKYESSRFPTMLTSIEDSLGNRVTFEYDEDQDDLDTRLNPRLKVKKIVDPAGAVFSYAYTAAGRRANVSVRSAGVDAAMTNSFIRDDLNTRQRFVEETATTFLKGYIVDAAGNTVPLPAGAAPIAIRRTRYSDDGRYNVLQEIDPLGRATEYVYNEYNLLTGVKDIRGHWTRYSYDLAGQPTPATPLRYDLVRVDREELLRQVAPGPEPRAIVNTPTIVSRVLTYERYSTVSASVPSDRGIHSTHRVASDTNEKSKTWRYTYDDSANFGALDPTECKSPLGFVSIRRYDANGDVVFEQDPEGFTREFKRNSRGLIESFKDPSSNLWTIDHYANEKWPKSFHSPSGAVNSFVRDVLGRLTTHSDAVGDTTVYGYDGCSRVISISVPRQSVTTPSGISVTPFASLVTGLTYNGIGRLASLTDPDGNVLEFEYDEAGRLIDWFHAIAGFSRTRRVYDLAGQLLTVTDRLNRSTNYTYNPDGTLRTIEYPQWTDGAAAIIGKRVEFSLYDYSGRVLTRKDSEVGGDVETAFDPAGNLVYRRHEDGIAENLTFDDDDRLALITSSNGVFGESRTLDGAGQIVALTDSTYADGAVTWRNVYRPGMGTTAFSQLRHRFVDAIGLRTTFGYSLDGQRTAVSHNNMQAGTAFFNQSATLSADERIAQIVGTDTNSFLRDGAKQLIYEASQSVSSDYDRNGNRTFRATAAGVQISSINPPNRIVADPSTTATTSYDAAGFLTTVAVGPTTSRLAFDGSGALRTFESPTVLINYTYDADGNLRVRTRHDKATGTASITQLRYSQGKPVEVTSNGGAPASLTWDNQGRLLRVRDQRFSAPAPLRQSALILGDVFDSNVMAVDSQLQVNEAAQYDVWGNRKTVKGVLGALLHSGFQGGQIDDETGLVRFGGRWYSPLLGRWVSEDPDVSPEPSRYHELTNLYRFCNNDPTYYRDSRGRDADLRVDVKGDPIRPIASNLIARQLDYLDALIAALKSGKAPSGTSATALAISSVAWVLSFASAADESNTTAQTIGSVANLVGTGVAIGAMAVEGATVLGVASVALGVYSALEDAGYLLGKTLEPALRLPGWRVAPTW